MSPHVAQPWSNRKTMAIVRAGLVQQPHAHRLGNNAHRAQDVRQCLLAYPARGRKAAAGFIADCQGVKMTLMRSPLRREMAASLGALIGIVVAGALAATTALAYAFTSTEANFTADFPSEPTLSKTTAKAASGIPYDQYTWSVSTNAGFWAVLMGVPSQHVEWNYDAAVKGAVNAVNGKLRIDNTIQQSGVQGRDIIIDVSGANTIELHQRMLWINDRLYQMMFAGGPGSATKPEAEAFLSSFHTLK
jgi:hypothetical protein